MLARVASGVQPESEGGKRGRETLGKVAISAHLTARGLGRVAVVKYNRTFLDARSDFSAVRVAIFFP